MKKVTLIVVLTLMGLVGYAQDAQEAQEVQEVQTQVALKFGYLSYDSVFQAMPEYATMQASMQQLRDKYAAEQKRVEEDFNKKYEEFLDGQASYPRTILQKRQSELQEILDKNIAFKKESEKLLSRAQYDAIAPLKQKLDEILRKIGEERGFAFILNTDNNNAPWLNPAMGEDITEAVKALLQ